MNKLIFVLFSLIMILSANGSAQTSAKPYTLYLSGGGIIPVESDQFTDFHKLGYNLNAGIGFSVMPKLQTIARIGFYKVIKDWDAFNLRDELNNDITDQVSGGAVTAFTYGIDLRIDLSAPLMPIKPFLIGGIGFAKLSESDINTSFPGGELWEPSFIDDGNKFYWSVGGGLQLTSSPLFSLYIEIRYISFEQDTIAEFPVDNIGLIPINVGIKF